MVDFFTVLYSISLPVLFKLARQLETPKLMAFGPGQQRQASWRFYVEQKRELSWHLNVELKRELSWRFYMEKKYLNN